MRLVFIRNCSTKCLHIFKRSSPCKARFDQCFKPAFMQWNIFRQKLRYLCSCLLCIYFLFFCTLKAFIKSKSCINETCHSSIEKPIFYWELTWWTCLQSFFIYTFSSYRATILFIWGRVHLMFSVLTLFLVKYDLYLLNTPSYSP